MEGIGGCFSVGSMMCLWVGRKMERGGRGGIMCLGDLSREFEKGGFCVVLRERVISSSLLWIYVVCVGESFRIGVCGFF